MQFRFLIPVALLLESVTSQIYGNFRTTGTTDLSGYRFSQDEAEFVDSALPDDGTVRMGRTQELYSYLGCFNDNVRSRALPVYAGITKHTADCMKACKDKGYPFFGTQWYKECWCGGSNALDRSYARYGSTNTCKCDTDAIGGSVNCAYRIWPTQENSDYLPELSCFRPDSDQEGAVIKPEYCSQGGKHMWLLRPKNRVEYGNGSGRCIMMKHANGKTKLHLKTCKETPDQTFDITNNCLEGVCDETSQGLGFSGECPSSGEEGKCLNGHFWYNQMKNAGSHYPLTTCKQLVQNDPSSVTGAYDMNDETHFCDLNDDARIKILANTGYCLDIPGGTPHDGETVQMYSCHGGKNQQWTIDETDQIRSRANVNYCLFVDAVANGNLLKIGSCGTSNNYKWSVRSDGSVRSMGNSNICIDAFGGTNIHNGQKVGIWSCHLGLNQKWVF